MSRIIAGPFNRVEGEVSVRLDIKDNRIADAAVTSPMYRGFEQILIGKPAIDALVYTPRICGICSVSQSIASAYALNNNQPDAVPANARLAINLIHATENILDHLTHFYLFFMPDFARDDYSGYDWHSRVRERFAAQRGSAMNDILPARNQLLKVMGLLAGKWPHTLSIQPGGISKSISKQEQIELIKAVRTFQHFMEQTLYAASTEQILELDTEQQLADYGEQTGDFATFIHIARTLELNRLGPTDLTLMSNGSYYLGEGEYAFAAGTWQQGSYQPLDCEQIREFADYSYLADQGSGGHPSTNKTSIADTDKQHAYSWSQAPRLDGRVVEVGALARQVIDRQPLVSKLYQEGRGNVASRVIARIIESARIIQLMKDWAGQFAEHQPFYSPIETPDSYQSAGLTEAARGSLGHWLSVRAGRIDNYQIIAPTTWNFSPMDGHQRKGALEQALIGTEVIDRDSVPIDHIIRSFDPCMVCTAH